MSPRPRDPDIAVCVGSDCAKDARKRHRELTAQLAEVDAEVVTTKCLGVCRGPVVVLAPRSETAVVVEKVKRTHAPLVAGHARDRTRPQDDSPLRVVEGKERGKALGKARRRLG